MSVTPEVLATGYQLVEGPRADHDGGVYFTDALGGGVYRWSKDGVDTIVPKRKGVGGLALHTDGGVVVSGRDVTHVAPDGTNRLLFAAPEGVTGFNDICATSDGSILAGGLRFLPFADEEPKPGAFWHVSAPEQAELALEDVMWPNGVGDAGLGIWCFCDYSRGRVTIVEGDEHRTITTPSGEADGLAFDVDDGLWVAQPRAQSLVRITLDGEVDRTIDLPGVQPASLAFDGDVLYVTTIANETRSGELLRLDAPIAGRRHHYATI
jgi:sugar lactone lactonase YvrE